MELSELRIQFQALKERHDKVVQDNLEAREAISAHKAEINDALQQEIEIRSTRTEVERRLEAMRAKCLTFAEKYLEASTTQKQFAEEYKEGLVHWQGKIKDLVAEREGLWETIVDQREKLRKQDQLLQDARCVQIEAGLGDGQKDLKRKKKE
ncbi:hypothetical protein QFC22_006754 [Naganishia vaughanmartiniae]|uniref:Uncharacterized protein n=1 Tax=Naganishia vaughanmartiniae TaxID=1424756 RepID=A0ACC2WI37_9TREE|nr:hypothetical protein QFC22_006754 [Naganishia vaughanmartiniae]